jgi:serine protease Do
VLALLALFLGASAGRAQNPQQPAAREVQSLPSLAPLVESVKSAVVNVEVQSRVNRPQLSMGPDEFGGDDLFDRFFGGRNRPRRPDREQIRQGMGSGFIIDPRGYVLTNNHVVQDAVNIRVRLDDGRDFEAKTMGRDPLTDVALIKLTGKVENLPVVKLGDSDASRVGDWVVAIGNPFGLASSVSAGIISAKSREIRAITPYDDFIQTDAAINPGNSGGPLFNLRGEVIGINTAIVGGGTGIGFAVPSNIAKALVPQLEKDGTVSRGYLGVGIQDLTPDLAKALGVPVNEGAVVTEVRDGSPAKKAGLLVDDVIAAIDGKKLTSSGALTRAVGLMRPGSTVTLTVYRGQKQQEVKVLLATRPDLEGIGQQGEERTSTDEEGKKQQKIGLSVQNVTPRYAESLGIPPEGALVADVVPGSPAEQAGLAPGMVVVEAGKKPVRNRDDLLRAIKSSKPGSSLLLRVLQPGRSATGERTPQPTLHVLKIP